MPISRYRSVWKVSLKNPLSSLRSATETFGRARTAEQKEKLLNVILQDVSRLDRLITDISQASRVDYTLNVLKESPLENTLV